MIDLYLTNLFFIQLEYGASTGKSFSEAPFFVHQKLTFLDKIYRFLLFVQASAWYLAPHACNSDLRVSADLVDVRNDP